MFYSDKPNLLSDENVPAKLTELLRQKGFNVNIVPLGSTDRQISKIAKEKSRIMLTFDKHFINRRLFPPKEHPGIIFMDIHPPKIDVLFLSLLKLFDKVKPAEFKGKLFIVSSFGFRIKE
ncbi:DUF5615 family PIN-like protein [Candidatus Pacearchaeota archaeon]|nr:DUF5615 family PIN-like protein [Candidatus Pacearchaeota archaeon]